MPKLQPDIAGVIDGMMPAPDAEREKVWASLLAQLQDIDGDLAGKVERAHQALLIDRADAGLALGLEIGRDPARLLYAEEG